MVSLALLIITSVGFGFPTITQPSEPKISIRWSYP